MKLLLDMNLSPAWETVFRTEGWESVHWSHVGRFDAPDAEIMAWARREGFVAVTQDLDFSAILATTRAEGPSVVQVRAQDIVPGTLGPELVGIIRRYSELLERGAILTVDLPRWRVRMLPFT